MPRKTKPYTGYPYWRLWNISMWMRPSRKGRAMSSGASGSVVQIGNRKILPLSISALPELAHILFPSQERILQWERKTPLTTAATRANTMGIRPGHSGTCRCGWRTTTASTPTRWNSARGTARSGPPTSCPTRSAERPRRTARASPALPFDTVCAICKSCRLLTGKGGCALA